MNAELRRSSYCADNADDAMKHEHYLYMKSYHAVHLAICYGELRPREVRISERWGGALSIYIPRYHLQKDSPDPRETTIATLQTFLHNGANVETFTLGYDTVGFWSTTEREWLLQLTTMNLFNGLGFWAAHFTVKP